jgi:hypothetical protein
MTDPDDLVHRLKKNPRDPELLRQLDQAAWETFHDPWERPPAEKSGTDSESTNSGGSMEAPPLPRLHATVLRSALKELGLRFTTAPGGGFLVKFSYDHDADCEALVQISIQGEDKDVLAWHMASDRRVDAPQFGLAFRLCSEWAKEQRWPRAFVDIPAVEEDGKTRAWEPSGSIELDYHYPVPDGISRQSLCKLLGTLFSSGMAFYALAREKYGL